MEASDFIKQHLATQDKYWADRRAKETKAAPGAAGSSTTTTTTTTTVTAATAASATKAATSAKSGSGSAYNVQISAPAAPIAPPPAKPKTAAQTYGSFYLSSPNGDKLAELRKKNDAMVVQKIGKEAVSTIPV